MKEDGFTLLEVVVAFAIGSLALTALYDVTGTSLDRQRKAVKRLDQVAVAERLMESVGTEFPLGETIQEGVTDAGVNWSLSIERENAEGDPPLFAIKVEAWEDDQTEAVRFSTYRLGPKE